LLFVVDYQSNILDTIVLPFLYLLQTTRSNAFDVVSVGCCVRISLSYNTLKSMGFNMFKRTWHLMYEHKCISKEFCKTCISYDEHILWHFHTLITFNRLKYTAVALHARNDVCITYYIYVRKLPFNGHLSKSTCLSHVLMIIGIYLSSI